MINTDPNAIEAIRALLQKIDYAFFLKQMHGVADFQDPWYDFPRLEANIESSPCRFKRTIKLIHMGIPAAENDLLDEIDANDIAALLQTGLWLRRDGLIVPDNYVILVYQQLFFVVEIKPAFPTCTRPMTDVYIGSDSLRLAENIAFAPGSTVLDLCSGSGIQGILAARSAKKVVSVEINSKAVPAIEFNAELNGLAHIIDARCGDLYDVLAEDEFFDYIYANPPFLPVPDDISYPVCGAAADDGLAVLKGIIEGMKGHMAPGATAVLFCEALGDENRVFFTEWLKTQETSGDWNITECRYSRIPKDQEIRNMLFLSKMFDPALDEAKFVRDMEGIFRRTGGEYLYSLLYRIRSGADRPAVDIIDHCLPARSLEDEIRMLEVILAKMKAAAGGGSCCGGKTE